MDINPQSAKPISDDQELAKVLAGVSQQPDEPLQTETTPVITTTAAPLAADPAAPADDAATPAPAESTLPTPSIAPPIGYNPPESSASPYATAAEPSVSTDLSEIKKEALSNLRPLVDKLDIPSDEKFDTYLLLIRSTDDKALVAPAYAAAQAITDEARKAQALLDIIKEIDYLSNPPQ